MLLTAYLPEEKKFKTEVTERSVTFICKSNDL
jgi:hypothetical protein